MFLFIGEINQFLLISNRGYYIFQSASAAPFNGDKVAPFYGVSSIFNFSLVFPLKKWFLDRISLRFHAISIKHSYIQGLKAKEKKIDHIKCFKVLKPWHFHAQERKIKFCGANCDQTKKAIKILRAGYESKLKILCHRDIYIPCFAEIHREKRPQR